ncbi:hypothetical protein [Myceligenerans xiligouense]|uniref:DUF3800 domain-containing protein n=1 Tax=Myceligenerans xiligouense TaxID=253184 RepID=A0A3N4YKD1_9MICO|nr:hypothetical protein [Myceligenerans xiligouense]RPF20537.1 hypothetical protein EDD34_1133 [Myceligenerans xiligouense]
MLPTDRPDADDFLLHAWVDESMRMSQPGRPGAYFLAAAVAEPSVCEPVRESLRELVLRGADRLHWRHESAPRQAKIASVIAEHDLVHLVVVGSPLDSRKQERARRHCMERLLFELEDLEVSRVWLERRTKPLNTRDMLLIDTARIKGIISPRLTVDFADPCVEPMLWTPDAVAGIVGQAAVGTESLRSAIESSLTEVRIDFP